MRCGKPHPCVLLERPLVERPEWMCFGCYLLDPASEAVRADAMDLVRALTMDGADDDDRPENPSTSPVPVCHKDDGR